MLRIPKMRKEYVALLLGGFLTAMTASGASYITTKENVATQNVRLVSIEERINENVQIHKDLFSAIQKMSDDSHKTQIALTEIATIIKVKLGDSPNVGDRNKN